LGIVALILVIIFFVKKEESKDDPPKQNNNKLLLYLAVVFAFAFVCLYCMDDALQSEADRLGLLRTAKNGTRQQGP